MVAERVLSEICEHYSLILKPFLESRTLFFPFAWFKTIKPVAFPTKDDFVSMLLTRNCCPYAVFHYWTVGINYYDIWLVHSVRFTEFTVWQFGGQAEGSCSVNGHHTITFTLWLVLQLSPFFCTVSSFLKASCCWPALSLFTSVPYQSAVQLLVHGLCSAYILTVSFHIALFHWTFSWEDAWKCCDLSTVFVKSISPSSQREMSLDMSKQNVINPA